VRVAVARVSGAEQGVGGGGGGGSIRWRKEKDERERRGMGIRTRVGGEAVGVFFAKVHAGGKMQNCHEIGISSSW
jgi:hypothetical protein